MRPVFALQTNVYASSPRRDLERGHMDLGHGEPALPKFRGFMINMLILIGKKI